MKSITGQLHDYKMLLMKPLSLNLKVSAVGMIIEGSVKVRGNKNQYKVRIITLYTLFRSIFSLL